MQPGVINLIKEYMRTEGIYQKDLCEGLCKKGTMSKYLSGSHRMDRLMLNAVLQRLGLSPDDFAVALSKAEYKYFTWRIDIIKKLQSGKWMDARELLKNKDNAHCNPHLEELYLVLTICQLRNDITEVKNIMEGILGILQDGHIDIREQIKIYPIVVCIYGDILFDGNSELAGKEEFTEYYDLCSRVIQLMRENNSAFLLERVLANHIKAALVLGEDDIVKRDREWQDAWNTIKELAGFEKKDGNLELAYMANFNQEIELINEIIRKGRREAGIKITDFSDTLDCEYVNLSRIETGRRTPRPTRYNKAVSSLNIRDGYYYTEIKTDDYQAYKLKYEIDKELSNWYNENIECILNRLEKKLDMNVVINRQYIMDCRYTAKYMQKKIDTQEYLKVERDLLKLTVDITNPNYKKRIFTSVEVDILTHIATGLQDLGSNQEKINLLEFLLEFYKKSTVSKEFHYRRIVLIYINLCVCYVTEGEWDKLQGMCIEGIEMELNCNKGKMVSEFLNFLGCICIERRQVIDSKNYFSLAITCSDMFLWVDTNVRVKKNLERLVNNSNVL